MFLVSKVAISSCVASLLLGSYSLILKKPVFAAPEPVKPGEVQFDLGSVKEPWVASEGVTQAGQKIYKQNCALCHGQKGDLVGGIATARNLVEGQWKAGNGMMAHFKVLQNGIPGTQMASFKTQLKPSERWAVLHFIETLTKNKSQDKPEDVAAFAATAD